MLAIQSDTAKYHSLYTQRAVAFQRSGSFFLLTRNIEFKKKHVANEPDRKMKK